MNKTELLFSLLPGKVRRKNREYTSFISRYNEGSEKRVKVGYTRTDARGKVEVLTLVDKPLKGEGLNKAMEEALNSLTGNGFVEMGYEVTGAQA